MKQFNHILFYEEDHKYVNTMTSKRYTSVTQTFEKIKPKVNWDYWAVYKWLKNNGYTVRPAGDEKRIMINNKPVSYKKYLDKGKLLREQWKDTSNHGKEKGTFVHLYGENLFNNKVIKVPAKYKDSVGGMLKFYNDNKHRTPIYAELIVADDEFCIAGQVDRPFFVKPGVIDIVDYKSDREIVFENKYSSLLKPCDDLPDCNFSKYTLQLNLYKFIIEKNTEWKVRDLQIVHLTDTDYKVIDVPYYDVRKLLI